MFDRNPELIGLYSKEHYKKKKKTISSTMQVPRITQISAILNYILLSVSVFPMIKKKEELLCILSRRKGQKKRRELEQELMKKDTSKKGGG